MAVFIKAIFNDRNFIKKSTLEQKTTNMSDAPEMGAKSGLGILFADLGNSWTMYGYSGGHWSYSAELFYFPAKRTTFACLVNTSRQFGGSSKVYSEFRLKLFNALINH